MIHLKNLLGPKMIILALLVSISHGQDCQVRVYTTDKDPHGINLRAGPGSEFPVLGVIPYAPHGTMLDLLRSSNGWFQVAMIQNVLEEDGVVPANLPDSAWIYGGLVGVGPQENSYGKKGAGLNLYSNPTIESPKVVHLQYSGQTGFDYLQKLIDCAGGWLKIEVKNSKTHKTNSGWLHPHDQCPSPLTTCP